MAISDELVGKNGEERAQIKALRLVEFAQPYLPYTYSYIGEDGSTYSITANAISYDVTRHLFSVSDITATKDGIPLVLNLPFEYMNPPILIVTGVKPNGDLITKEDPLEAIKNMVGRTVEVQGG